MKAPRTPAARRAIQLFDEAPRGDRFHVRMRWWTCPFPAIERHVPVAGRVLEVGCGHGLLSLYLALSAPGRHVLGVDIDAHKIALAERASARLDAGEASIEFAVPGEGEFAPGSFDAIVIADVLYLLGGEARRVLLDSCIKALEPEGVLVVKETDRYPRWKAALTLARERVSTVVLKITAGDEVEFAAPAEFVAQLEGAGLDVVACRVDRGYVHPHHLIVARNVRRDA